MIERSKNGEALGQVLLRGRKAKSWSMARAANEAGISAAYVQKLERGDVDAPSPHKLRALADALDLPYLQLMRLAGYDVSETESTEAGSTTLDPDRALALALQTESVSPDEVEELRAYLQFRRQQKTSLT